MFVHQVLPYKVATFRGKPRNLEKLGEQKMIREKLGINQKVREFVWSGKTAFATRNLTLTITTCSVCIDSTTVCNYRHMP
jgi:hypothetical protein